MRGFTMLLVVIAHVGTFGMNLLRYPEIFTYQKLFGEFRMPLFFFVSGFVLYKAGFVWNFKNTITFLKKKISVQIIAPLLFMLSFIWVEGQDIAASFIDPYKRGYWFTFTLFEFFLFYIILNQTLDLCRLSDGVTRDIILLLTGCCFCILGPAIGKLFPMTPYYIYGLLGIHHWHLFIYFIIGTRIRKHFSRFERILDQTTFITICIVSFITLNLFKEQLETLLAGYLFNLSAAISGVVIVFALFRKNATVFSHEYAAGRVLQYIGRRTLDIYLIHYFFVRSNMEAVLPDFGQLDSPFLGFVLQIFIAALVVAACLAVSHVLRLSPVIAHYCFGQKYKQQ